MQRGSDLNVFSISDRQSIAFDLARIIATFAVFFQHATGDLALYEGKISLLGRAVIPVFLVISGYMTAIAAMRGGKFLKKSIRRYLKYYFVVVPAVVILFICDIYLVSVNSPILESVKFENAHTPYTFLRELFQAVTFSGEYWRLTTESQGLFGSTSFWTMDYILAYAVATMALYILSGVTRILTLLAIAALSGPTVLLLAPLWFCGVLACEVHRRIDETIRHKPELAPKVTATTQSDPIQRYAFAAFAIGLAWCTLVEWSGLGADAYAYTKNLASYEWRQHLGMAKRFLWQWLHLPGLFLMLIATGYLVGTAAAPVWRDRLRQAAFYTFPVYIVHFSFIYLAQSMMPDYRAGPEFADPYIMMTIAMAFTLLFSWATITFVQPVADRWIARLF